MERGSLSAEDALELELCLDPGDVRPLLRRFRAARGRTLSLKWHDTADGALAGRGLAIIETRQARATLWRVERIAPDAQAMWPCGMPAPTLQETPHRAALDGVVPKGSLHPLAEFWLVRADSCQRDGVSVRPVAWRSPGQMGCQIAGLRTATAS